MIRNLLFTIAMITLVGVVALNAQDKTKKEEPKKMENQTSKNIVVMETSMGTVEIELYPDKAPKTVENFLSYVKEKYYDGTIFHRVINNFMIQGGGFTADRKEKKTKPSVINEADNGLKNDLGTLAMARTPDPNSATSQFFINVKNNDFLNFTSKSQNGWGYCVFAKVISGMDVVNKIKAVPTGTAMFSSQFQDVPKENVVIVSVREKSGKDEKKEEQKK